MKILNPWAGPTFWEEIRALYHVIRHMWVTGCKGGGIRSDDTCRRCDQGAGQ